MANEAVHTLSVYSDQFLIALDCLCFNCKKHLHSRTYVCIIEI